MKKKRSSNHIKLEFKGGGERAEFFILIACIIIPTGSIIIYGYITNNASLGFDGNDNTNLPGSLIGIVMIISGILLLSLAFRAYKKKSLLINEKCIEYRIGKKDPNIINWSEIDSIHYNTASDWLNPELPAGDTRYISIYKRSSGKRISMLDLNEDDGISQDEQYQILRTLYPYVLKYDIKINDRYRNVLKKRFGITEMDSDTLRKSV